MSTDLFVGLVTYPSTRFPEAREEMGLMASVARAATRRGLTTETAIAGVDLYTKSNLPLGPSDVAASIDAELQSELRWRSFIAQKPPSLVSRLLFRARRLYRRQRFMTRVWRRSSAQEAGVAMARRLANIEASHLTLMDLALASQAEWVLILEDDASSADVAVLSEQIAAFIDGCGDDGADMLSLSDSFSLRELEIEHLVSPLDPLVTPWTVFSTSLPVTNTVCAMLYRREFLSQLKAALDEIPLRPIVPIDFKVNNALMEISAARPVTSSWIAAPGPVVQLSGVPAVKALHR